MTSLIALAEVAEEEYKINMFTDWERDLTLFEMVYILTPNGCLEQCIYNGCTVQYGMLMISVYSMCRKEMYSVPYTMLLKHKEVEKLGYPIPHVTRSSILKAIEIIYKLPALRL